MEGPPKSTRSKSRRRSELSKKNETDLATFIYKSAEYEEQIDQLRVNLAAQPDFTVEECFALFDRGDKGLIHPIDVKATFDILGIPSYMSDVEEFIRRHDADRDGHLNLDELEHVIMPVSEVEAMDLKE